MAEMLQVFLRDDGHPWEDLQWKHVLCGMCVYQGSFLILSSQSLHPSLQIAAKWWHWGKKNNNNLGRRWRMADKESNLNFPSPWPALWPRVLFSSGWSVSSWKSQRLLIIHAKQGFDSWGFVCHTFKRMKLNLGPHQKNQNSTAETQPHFPSLIPRNHSPSP